MGARCAVPRRVLFSGQPRRRSAGTLGAPSLQNGPLDLARTDVPPFRDSPPSRPAVLPIGAVSAVLSGLDSLRNVRALAVLLGSFATSGLLLAMAQAALAKGAGWWGPIEAGAALTVAFYGGNAAGLLVMDEACGRPVRDIGDAVRGALASAHRLLAALLLLLTAGAVIAGAMVGLLWLSRLAVAGPVLGPVLFGVLVPLAVLTFGLLLLALLAVVVPLAAPSVWSGAGVGAVVHGLLLLIRQRLLAVALLMAAVGLLAAAVGAVASFVVVAGGRVLAEVAVAVVGVDVPADQLMAGLFGHGLRSQGAVGAPVAASAHGAAALVGGGVVFALGLVLPGLVYLRGACAVYLALTLGAAER